MEKPITMQKLLSTVERAMKYNASQSAAATSLDKLGKSTVVKELMQQVETPPRKPAR